MINCVNCGRAMRPRNIMNTSQTIRVEDPDQLFCTLRCGFRYGVRVAHQRIRGQLVPAKGGKS